MIAARAFAILLVSATLYAAPFKTTYWIAPCTDPASMCRASDVELAEWAFNAWQKASDGALEFTRVGDRNRAHIRLYWATAEQGMYGETRPLLIDGEPGAEVFVRPSPSPANGDGLLRDAIVYLTCLHESGHALGLAHTRAFDDIMYSFQFGGDIEEYFGRYRRKLTTRGDIAKNAGLSTADEARLRKEIERRRSVSGAVR